LGVLGKMGGVETAHRRQAALVGKLGATPIDYKR